MFSNIGRKCKAVAKVLCFVGIVSSLILGVFLFSVSVFYGLGFIIGGSVGFWLSSIGLYGIGEAVENSAIAANLAIKADMEREKDTEKAKELDNDLFNP